MKNDDLQRMGVTPWLGDTRVMNKGGKAAKRTLTDLCREARAVRDECKVLRNEVCHVLKSCVLEREEVERLRRLMRRDLVRLAWFAGGLSLVNVGVVCALLHWMALWVCGRARKVLDAAGVENE